jgi:hypothetical protein
MTSFSTVPRTLRLSNSRRAAQFALLADAAIAGLAGWVAGSPGETATAVLQAGPDLALLLRFMACIKALFAVALVLLAAWRFAYPVGSAAALGYTGATALMCAAPGLIWTMSHVAAGALVFHAGLLLFLGTAWRDSTKPATRLVTWFARPRAKTNDSGSGSILRPAN